MYDFKKKMRKIVVSKMNHYTKMKKKECLIISRQKNVPVNVPFYF